MAITITSDYAGRSGTSTSKTTEYERRLTAVSDTIVAFADIAAAPACPKYMSVYGPEDLGARCVKLQIDEDANNELVYRIKANYSTDYGDPEQEEEENPLLRPAIWRYNTERGTKTLPHDRKGNYYETTAGEPFQSPPPIVYSTARYTITRNQSYFSSADADNWANTVNADTWYGKLPGTVLCEGIDADEKYEGKYHFFVVTFKLHVDRNNWSPVQVANRGSSYFAADGITRITTQTPVYLTAAGKLWTILDPLSDKYRDYYPYDEIPFSQFQL